MAFLNKQHSVSLSNIYSSHRFTFFCHQPYQENGSLILPRCKTCPSSPLKIQWMPIIPLKKLGAHLSCYRNKQCVSKTGKFFSGLRCCQKNDLRFIKMVQDLYNYVPENPLLIQMKKQYAFGDFDHSDQPSSRCHFYVDKKRKQISPASHTRGMIARTYLYFHQQYQLPLSDNERTLFLHWHQTYPPSEWETQRADLIFKQQGIRFPF